MSYCMIAVANPMIFLSTKPTDVSLIVMKIRDKAGQLKDPDVYPDNKVQRANMGPIWGRQDPGGPHVGPMNLAIWVIMCQQTSGIQRINSTADRWRR